MRVRSSLPAACAAVALLASVGVPALADSPAVPAAGTATSLVSLLSVSAAGHDLAAGGVRLVADTVDGVPVAKVVVTPLVADGKAYGEQSFDAGTSRTVDGASSAALVPALKGIAELTAPDIRAGASVADDAPTTTAGADSLGALSVLGLPVDVKGVLRTGSAVSGTAAQSTKTLEVTDVALPSIADLLAALGLDLSKLPVEVVDELVAKLDLVTPAVTTANKALDDAQAAVKTQTDAATAEVTKQLAAVDAAQKDLTAKTTALAPLESALVEKNAALAAANTVVQTAKAALDAALAEQKRLTDELAALPALVPDPLDALLEPVVNPAIALTQAALAEATALVASTTATLADATAKAAAAKTVADLAQVAVDTAKAAVELAKQALATVNALLDAAQKALAAIVATLAPQVSALLAALTAVLDGTPLVSLDRVAVTTESVVTSATAGGQQAGVEGGTVSGLDVLGTDVLDDVLGRSTLAVTALTGTTLTQVTDLLGTLTGTLSEVLSTVPGLPTLKVPAPQVQLLTKSVGTALDGAFGTATTSVTGLKVTIPAITLPVEVALPSALSLPGLSVLPKAALKSNLSAQAVGDVLTSTATTIGLGTLTEAARFRPGVAAVVTPPAAAPTTGQPTTGTPTTGSPTVAAPVTSPVSLPRTGTSGALAVLALGLVGTAVVLRRREVAAAE